jgi:hypothetical protein
VDGGEVPAEEVFAKNNGLSYTVSFHPNPFPLLPTHPNYLLQVEFNGNNLPLGSIATMEMVDPLTGEILAYDELIVDEYRSKKGGLEVKLLFVKNSTIACYFSSEEIYRGKYNLDWLEINFFQMTPFEGKFKDGKKDGKWTVWYENGQIRSEGNYYDGKPYGIWTEWYENGQKKIKSNYKDGNKKDGKWTEWYENGQNKIEGKFKDGKKDGKWTWWHQNGRKWKEENYKDGVEVD